MGKIKVRTIGDENLEETQKNEQKKKREVKKLAKVAGRGGERVVEVGPSEEELAKLDEKKTEEKIKESSEAGSGSARKKAKFVKPKRTRSKKYLSKVLLINKGESYPLREAIELLEKMQSPAAAGSRSGREKTFDETVELHLNTSDPKISAQTTLPHGTGKNFKVAIASDELIAEIEKGKINFDILLSSPAMMPKLARVAKILGPKGLMPNPKNATITNDPESAAKKYEGGLTFIKTEAKAPLIHVTVGKVSFGPKKLEENIDAIVTAVKKENIEKAVLKSTMSPAIRLSL